MWASTGLGTHHVRIQHNMTHRLRADDSLMTSTVSPSWISPAIASLSARPPLSPLPNMLRDGAYDSVPKFDSVSPSR